MTDSRIVLDMPEAEKFWARVDRTETCWEWTGSKTSGGYGNIRRGGRNDYAHRVAYRLVKGEIPEGLHIDHLCRNRKCVNPDHLEAVTPAENVRRGAAPYGPVRTMCKHGHDITQPENVYTEPGGNRRCRVCASLSDDKRREARQARGDLRKVLRTHCVNGHAFDERNTYVPPGSTARHCRACSRIRAAKQREAAR